MITIVIPTYNNLDYLKLCIKSIKNNSSNKYKTVLHINEGTDGTLDYANENNFEYSFSKKNIGLCTSLNNACKLVKTDYILYTHDDMYFCPGWDDALIKELKNQNDILFYLSGTMIEKSAGHIQYDCGDNLQNFDEKKLLNNYKNLNYYDHQGSHFAPHLIHKKIWNKIGGLSEEFNPGMCSDPDLNMKLWNEGVRVFKGINDFRVYHFGSLTTRRKKNLIQNKGHYTFLKKWKITHKFFTKHYLRSQEVFDGPLRKPNKNFFYFIELFICKIKLLFLLIKNE